MFTTPAAAPHPEVEQGGDPLSFVWLELTGKCQLQCRHCYSDSGPRETHGTMTRTDWMRIIDEAAGGATTLRPAPANATPFQEG